MSDFPSETAAAPLPVRSTARPLIGMIAGIASLFLSCSLLSPFVAISRYYAPVSTVLSVILALASLFLSVSGLIRSICTCGRKNVKNIVFSGVGIYTAGAALLFLLILFTWLVLFALGL